MSFDFATAWEKVAQVFPQRTAAICDGNAITWADYERRAASIAQLLSDYGLGADSKAGLYLHNCNEYLEAQFGLFKIGACPINVNYRYKADELVYLLDNSDVEAIFFQSCYAMRIWEIKDRLPKVKLFVQIDDGTEALVDFALDYERCVRDFRGLEPQERNPDGIYMLYTGGTTGMPKGVMYPVARFASFLLNMGAASHARQPPADMSGYEAFLRSVAAPPVSLVGCPLMHGTGVWLGCFVPMMLGGTVVTTAKLGLNPHRLWSLSETHRVSDVVIVGDAFARPMLAALDEAQERGTPYDLTSVARISSSGVMWSSEIKQGLLRHHDFVLTDIMGSTEGGMGSSVTTRESTVATAKFQINEGVRVIADDGSFVQPGSADVGMLATSALVPLGYYKDDQKSATTFREIDGVRYSFPGDYARVEADGTIVLLGRGSVCINTGGEKVFPEEVEEAVKRHGDVIDCLVVGVEDERFGERIVALVSCTADPVSQSAIQSAIVEFCADHLAGYKIPRQVFVVDEIRRGPNGKPDYKWAKSQAHRLVA